MIPPAYDIICSKLVIPREEDSALTINGKKDKLNRDDFDKLAEYLNIPIKIRYEKFENKSSLMKQIITESEINSENQAKFIDIIKTRLRRLNLKE
jgi:hypothetical protein